MEPQVAREYLTTLKRVLSRHHEKYMGPEERGEHVSDWENPGFIDYHAVTLFHRKLALKSGFDKVHMPSITSDAYEHKENLKEINIKLQQIEAQEETHRKSTQRRRTL